MQSNVVRDVVRRTPVLALLLIPAFGPVQLASPRDGLGRIEGRVRDKAGIPINNAQITVTGTHLSALSNRQGYYTLEKVPAGTVALHAAFIGYRAAHITGVRVVADSTITQDFLLEAAAIELAAVNVTSGHVQVPRDEVTARQGIVSSFEEASVMTGASSAAFGNAQPGTISTTGSAATPLPDREQYARIYENSFLRPTESPLSTFSIDVDAASYSNVRRFINNGQLPPRDAVRIEELVNYFPYDYPAPASDAAPFSLTTTLAPCPWAPGHRLALIGIKAREVPVADLPPSNLVFLLDVSGSMNMPDKLPLVKRAFRMLVNELRAQDRVAIVVYAGAAGLVLPSTPGSQKARILDALGSLEAGGATAGGEGIRLAYRIARENFLPKGNNRVILATDGDFNVGPSSDAELIRLIEEKRQEGTFLTVLGFGEGNLQDAKMEQLADKGNGHYAYVDGELEARKVFVREMGATLLTIAKDVKLQLEFNPARVRAYRLIGYENRMLAAQDFNDDRKDAGELGAGHAVTALYEIVPTGTDVALAPGIDSLRYQTVAAHPAAFADELMTVKLRYKDPSGDVSRLLTQSVTDRSEARGPLAGEIRFAAAVAEYGMILRKSEFRGSATLDGVLVLAQSGLGEDADGYRRDFVNLVKQTRSVGLASRPE